MAGNKVACILLFFSIAASAQSDRYIVFFKNKTGTPFSVSQPQDFLSAKALTRRAKSGVSVTADDLPVNPSYVSQVKGLGAKTFFTSRWVNALLVETTPAIISSITSLPFVLRTEQVAPGMRLMGGRLGSSKQLDAGSSFVVTDSQLEMLGIDKMHEDGYHGEGVMIAVLDAGFPGVNTGGSFTPMFNEGRMKMIKDFIRNSASVFQYNSHGTSVLSIMAGEAPDYFMGGAYKANFLLFVTEDTQTEYRIEEYNWLFAAEKADSAGADIIQSSLGYNTFDDAGMNYTQANLDGKTAVVSKAAAMARDRGIIIVVSAGNEGGTAWHSITPPADVDNILAVGAINLFGEKVPFSSYGPTADGRIKPDVVALGQSVSALLPGGAISGINGTSMAAPLISSLVAGLIQAHPELTPAQIVTTVKLSANKSSSPDNNLGYGLPNYVAVTNYLNSSTAVESLVIYPNPVSSQLNIAFKNLPEGDIEIYIYDVTGKVQMHAGGVLDWFSNPIPVTVSSLAAGTYYVRVQTASILKTLRFVKL